MIMIRRPHVCQTGICKKHLELRIAEYLDLVLDHVRILRPPFPSPPGGHPPNLALADPCSSRLIHAHPFTMPAATGNTDPSTLAMLDGRRQVHVYATAPSEKSLAK